MNHAKIRLSAKEMELVTNADWILTKNAVMQKAWQLLESLQERQRNILQSYGTLLPHEAVLTSPKISKGENYLGLPYLVLDQPRFFDRENIMAIRTMFWWGNFFSTTLHLAGKYKEQFAQKILLSANQLAGDGYYINVNEDEWQHHFGEDNYCLLKDINHEKLHDTIHKSSFIKLAQKIPLGQWDEAEEILGGYFKYWMDLMTVEQNPKK
jgi:hypothetical protein